MSKAMRVLSYVGTLLLGVALTIAILPKAFYRNTAGSTQGGSSKLDQLGDLLEEYYIEGVDRKTIDDAAAAAMIEASGDRWSFYIPAEQYASFLEQNANAYVGIGVTIQLNEEEKALEVIAVTPGGPAEEAGIQVRDFIVEANGQNCFDIGLTETTSIVKGKENTEVTLLIRRDGQEQTLNVMRRKVDVPVATWKMLESGYGLITIENFDSKCAKESIEAIEALMELDAKGIIFDVRFNGGGYQHELVKLLDYILPEGPLFRSESYDGKVTVDESDAGCIEIPMAVLVNGESYSAAEFFAAALQEYDYALVIGEPTSGKGHYQVNFPLSDGSAASISIGRYTTPNGVNLEGVGLTLDQELILSEEQFADLYYGQLDPEADPQVQAAVSALESQVNP